MPGDQLHHPPLTERITIALRELRTARGRGDVSREWAWSSMLDRLLDRYCGGER